MKIIEGYIKGFGTLSEKKVSFGKGLNTVCSGNGTGKSTLIAFIKAMLFGIGDSKKTSLFENDRQRYKPWQSVGFGGSLTVEVGDRRFRIERSFGKRPSEDSFRLFDAISGRESSEYGENIGEILLGLDADGAERTLFLTEKNLLPTTDSPTLSLAISGAVGKVTEADRLDEALLILDKQRKRYAKRGGGGEIDLCRDRITEVKRRLSALDSLISTDKEEGEKISAITKRLAELDTDTSSIRHRQGALVARGGNTLLTALFWLSLILTVAFAALAFVFTPLFYIPAAVLLIPDAALLIKLFRKSASKTRLDYEKLDSERADLDSERVRLIEERAELIRRHEKTVDAILERDRLNAELSELKATLARLEDELFVIKEAAVRLKSANEALAKRHSGKAKRAFTEYLDIFSESAGMNLDTELNITKTEGAQTHPYESYSRATRDLYAFAARLAAADAVFGGRCPFLILDDPFAAFDDKRLATALEFIFKLSSTRQIIYFTASKSRLPAR